MRLTIAGMKLFVAALGVASVVAGSVIPANADPPAATERAPAASTSAASSASAGCHRKSGAPFVVSHSLDAVQFVSGTTGWAVGANRVLATTDGGAHWSRQRSVSKADYSEVDAIDGDHAWVVGRQQLIVTTNGGHFWRRLQEPCPRISSVHFVSPTHGFAIAGGRLLKTTDGGKRWHHLQASAHAQSVCFTDTKRGWLGAHGQIYRTVNGGRGWALAVAGVREHDAHPHAGSGYTADVECAGTGAGWAELVGEGAASHQAHIGLHLGDSGSRPIFAEQMFPHPGVKVRREAPSDYSGAFSAVGTDSAVFVDNCVACDLGTATMAIATNNGKRLDRVGRVHHVDGVNSASFVSMADGWVIGSVNHLHSGRPTWTIVHTTDGGHHWTTQYVE